MNEDLTVARKDIYIAMWTVLGSVAAAALLIGTMLWDTKAEISSNKTDIKHIKAQLGANGYVLGKWKKGDVLVPVFPTKGGDAPLFKVVPAGKAVEQLKWPK